MRRCYITVKTFNSGVFPEHVDQSTQSFELFMYSADLEPP